MKRYIIGLVLVLGAFSVSDAQDEKIKGDRNVTVKQTYLDAFQGLIISTELDIDLVYNAKPSVEIEADDNLHDVIVFEVSDGVLSIGATKRITSRRKLNITINYSEPLNLIEVHDKSELHSLTSLELNDVELTTTGNSKTYLNIKAKNFKYTSEGKSKMRLNLSADSTAIVLSDDSKLEALINSPSATYDLYQRADADIEGDAENVSFRIDNSSNFKGKNYTIMVASLLIEGNSDATLHVEDSISINASGDSEIYLFGEPKISLDTFTGTCKLQKKEL
ncbi:DUF2807 domain-containing protein [Winogradskyella maritima]|uniref:GIN domain-containing protein n=1 Tax=Winogradskyella maritima TaxID=1517766 RepID=A0ABV8AIY7_9FLAO|nr:DUF2807 domain-containing protein [Winogradskyella maritima]